MGLASTRGAGYFPAGGPSCSTKPRSCPCLAFTLLRLSGFFLAFFYGDCKLGDLFIAGVQIVPIGLT